MTERARHWLVVPAAGRGRRLGAERPKQHLPLAGDTVLHHCLRRLCAALRPRGVVVVLAEDDPWAPPPDLAAVERVAGGAERVHSVYNAVCALAGRAADEDWVWVHDAARPALPAAAVQRLLAALEDEPVGALLAVPVHDTLKRADDGGRVAATEDRRGLWRAQTPQVFRRRLLHEALAAALAAGELVTDEAAAVERLGLRPRLVPGDPANLKITTAEDLALAEWYLTRSGACA